MENSFHHDYLLTYELPQSKEEKAQLLADLQQALQPYLRRGKVPLFQEKEQTPSLVFTVSSFSSLDDVVAHFQPSSVSSVQQSFLRESSQNSSSQEPQEGYQLTPLESYLVLALASRNYQFIKKFSYIPTLIFRSRLEYSPQNKLLVFSGDRLLLQYAHLFTWEEDHTKQILH